MKNIVFLLILVALLYSCKARNNSRVDPHHTNELPPGENNEGMDEENQEQTNFNEEAMDENINQEEVSRDIEDEEGWDESLGNKILRGTPYGTKGATPMLMGVMLTDREVTEKNGLYPASSARLAGQVWEVEGEVIRHHCGAMEQCLSQGYIDTMRKIKRIERVEN